MLPRKRGSVPAPPAKLADTIAVGGLAALRRLRQVRFLFLKDFKRIMQQTFEHLLGLPAAAAIAILASYGITNVDVVATAAPPRRSPSPEDALRSDEGERQGYASTRVVAVENDGRRLIVSRFLTGDPRDRERSGL